MASFVIIFNLYSLLFRRRATNLHCFETTKIKEVLYNSMASLITIFLLLHTHKNQCAMLHFVFLEYAAAPPAPPHNQFGFNFSK